MLLSTSQLPFFFIKQKPILSIYFLYAANLAELVDSLSRSLLPKSYVAAPTQLLSLWMDDRFPFFLLVSLGLATVAA
jgi:hypothetical protein